MLSLPQAGRAEHPAQAHTAWMCQRGKMAGTHRQGGKPCTEQDSDKQKPRGTATRKGKEVTSRRVDVVVTSGEGGGWDWEGHVGAPGRPAKF